MNENNPTVILSYHRKLVDYYISKGFDIIEKNSSDLIDVHLRVKQIINAEILHKNDYEMACYIENPSDVNSLKIITICSSLYREFESTYYNDKRDAIRYIFGEYIKQYLKDIDHPALIEEWKLKFYKAAYEKNLELGVNKNSLKKVIDRHDSQEFFPKIIMEDI